MFTKIKHRKQTAQLVFSVKSYNLECNWLVELSGKKLSNNKLYDNNLATELVENMSFLNQSQSRKLQFLCLHLLTLIQLPFS